MVLYDWILSQMRLCYLILVYLIFQTAVVFHDDNKIFTSGFLFHPGCSGAGTRPLTFSMKWVIMSYSIEASYSRVSGVPQLGHSVLCFSLLELNLWFLLTPCVITVLSLLNLIVAIRIPNLLTSPNHIYLTLQFRPTLYSLCQMAFALYSLPPFSFIHPTASFYVIRCVINVSSQRYLQVRSDAVQLK